MLEVAEIVRLHGEAYLRQFGSSLSSAQKRALRDISACRTPLLGGHLYQCGHCQEKVFSYHSCRNRSCPKCHQAQTERWIEKQRGRLPACSYFLVTFTLPAELRPLARTHPKKIYSLLMKAAADALQKLAADPQYLGARLGILAVLHTWTRAMLSPARSHAGHRRRPRPRRPNLGEPQTSEIPGSRPCPVGDLPREILCGIEKGGIALQCARLGLEEKLGGSFPTRRTRGEGARLPRALRLQDRYLK